MFSISKKLLSSESFIRTFKSNAVSNIKATNQSNRMIEYILTYNIKKKKITYNPYNKSKNIINKNDKNNKNNKKDKNDDFDSELGLDFPSSRNK